MSDPKLADGGYRIVDCKRFGLRTVQADQTAIFDVVLLDRSGVRLRLPALNAKGGEFDFGMIRRGLQRVGVEGNHAVDGAEIEITVRIAIDRVVAELFVGKSLADRIVDERG